MGERVRNHLSYSEECKKANEKVKNKTTEIKRECKERKRCKIMKELIKTSGNLPLHISECVNVMIGSNIM